MSAAPIEPWRRILRQGLLPSLLAIELRELRIGLVNDSPRIQQCAITILTIPGRDLCRPESIQYACPLGFAIWRGGTRPKEGGVEDRYQTILRRCKHKLKHDWDHVPYLNWELTCSRDELRRELIAEIDRELVLRKQNRRTRGLRKFSVNARASSRMKERHRH